MKFSFSKTENHAVDLNPINTDVFCYFSFEDSVFVPADLWLKAIATSLKLKRNVLILEKPLKEIPEIRATARWQVGDDFLWLAPRSLSPILKAVHTSSSTYSGLKTHLRTLK